MYEIPRAISTGVDTVLAVKTLMRYVNHTVDLPSYLDVKLGRVACKTIMYTVGCLVSMGSTRRTDVTRPYKAYLLT